MASSLTFEFEWQDPQGIGTPELAVTFARLAIKLDGVALTQVLDHQSQSVRAAIYVPLYPLAEWIACHWFALLHEVQAPGRGDVASRHSLHLAREGFAFPSLSMVSEGEDIALRCIPYSVPFDTLDFLGECEERLARQTVEKTLSEFVDAVLQRMKDVGWIRPTLLEEEWHSVQNLPPEERAFCETAGALGFDPFSIESSAANAIEEAARSMPASLQREFFSSVPQGELNKQQAWIANALSVAGSQPQSESLTRMRSSIQKELQGITAEHPWETGYRSADLLRATLGLNGGSVPSALIEKQLGYALAGTIPDKSGVFDAITAVRKSSTALLAVTAGRENSRRFAYVRALYEYFSSPDFPQVISRAHTYRQKQSRAFAAQLLAPSQALKSKLSGQLVSEEEIADLAQEFEVSDYVVRHQIQNHRLARIA